MSAYMNRRLLVLTLFIFCATHGLKHGAEEMVGIESAPFVGSLRVFPGEHVCGASVVHRRFLLTAASCFVDALGNAVNITQVLVGTDDLAKGGILYDIKSLIPHEKYFLQTGDYNVGLVELKHKLKFDSKVNKVGISLQEVNVGNQVQIIGWGSMKNSYTTNKLRRATVKVVQRSACRSRGFGRIISAREMCADGGEYAADIGGPVLFEKKLVAIASVWCGHGRNGLLTRISAFEGWVTTTIGNRIDLENNSSMLRI